MDKQLARRNGSNLTLQTKEALQKRISEGPVAVGEKLPTEKALALEFGVSRTVIREAIAALRSDGMLQAKHGVGVFVSQKSPPAAPGRELHFSASALDMLELRMAVEMHGAGLAAARKSWAQEQRIYEAADAFATAAAGGEPTEAADWSFHRAIAEATNNMAFIEFFDRLGLSLLPRNSLEGSGRETLISKSYLEKTAAEHRAVCDAISRGDAEAAREAMRVHLGGSQSRYRGLTLASSPAVAPAQEGAGSRP